MQQLGMSSTKMKSLLKGLRYISQVFGESLFLLSAKHIQPSMLIDIRENTTFLMDLC